MRQNRSRVTLVVMEVALSVVLLISAGLLIRSFSAVIQQQPGFDAKGLTVGQIWIPIPNNPQVNQYLKPEQRADWLASCCVNLMRCQTCKSSRWEPRPTFHFSVTAALPSLSRFLTSTQRSRMTTRRNLARSARCGSRR